LPAAPPGIRSRRSARLQWFPRSRRPRSRPIVGGGYYGAGALENTIVSAQTVQEILAAAEANAAAESAAIEAAEIAETIANGPIFGF
jgi:hypothetical protein